MTSGGSNINDFSRESTYQNSCSLNSIKANLDQDQFKLPAKYKTVRSQGVSFRLS